jgi:chaperone required for assembly of F1-ATPase
MTRRFWTDARVTAHEDGFGVALDGRPVRLPSGTVLSLPTAALAEAVAAEWQAAGQAKGGSFAPTDVPLTGLAGSAQERVRPQLGAMLDSLAGYAEADLLCYRAERPESLVAAQAAQWQPWLDWAAESYGAKLRVTTGVVHVPQPPESVAALREGLARLSAEELAALGVAIPAFGSCVLGLALAAGAIAPDAAMQVAMVDELYQESRWGVVDDAAERRRLMAGEIELAARFMELCR